MKNIDVRVRLAAMLFVAAGILIIKTEYAVYMTLFLAFIWSGLIIGIKKVISKAFLFAVFEILLYILKDVSFLGNLPLLIVYLRRLVIAIIAAAPITNAPTGRLIASLDKLKIPRTFTISLSVLFRYLPTVKMEYSAIRQAQKYRGIGTNIRDLKKIPQLFEATMVPLLIRTTKIADELTASAEVRGMKLKGVYNSYYEVRMKLLDWLSLILFTICVFGIYYVDYILGA